MSAEQTRHRPAQRDQAAVLRGFAVRRRPTARERSSRPPLQHSAAASTTSDFTRWRADPRLLGELARALGVADRVRAVAARHRQFGRHPCAAGPPAAPAAPSASNPRARRSARADDSEPAHTQRVGRQADQGVGARPSASSPASASALPSQRRALDRATELAQERGLGAVTPATPAPAGCAATQRREIGTARCRTALAAGGDGAQPQLLGGVSPQAAANSPGCRRRRRRRSSAGDVINRTREPATDGP